MAYALPCVGTQLLGITPDLAGKQSITIRIEHPHATLLIWLHFACSTKPRSRIRVRHLATTWYGPTHLNDLAALMPKSAFIVADRILKSDSPGIKPGHDYFFGLEVNNSHTK